ncbi:beta-xylanase [Ktedonobacteria bacterium brp13]|nr:beta-xylanase [Ktedonobacteria bacterium brp13]
MAVTHPSIDTFDYSQGDELVAFAKAHGMQVQGANLLWTSEVPAWITQGGYTRNELLGILKDYITNVVGHYKGQVQSWEVVNEPLDTNEYNQPSVWDQVIGPDYIDYAFRWAHEADPQAKLYINEFGVETSNDKANQYYSLVQSLVKQGTPISGVGFEDHLDVAQQYPTAQMIANMQRFAKLGMQVEITEADVMLQNSTAPMTQKLNQQAQLYANLVHDCQAVQACNAVTIWGFTDRYTWIPGYTHHPDQPLLFDTQYRKKPAYYAVKNALLK